MPGVVSTSEFSTCQIDQFDLTICCGQLSKNRIGHVFAPVVGVGISEFIDADDTSNSLVPAFEQIPSQLHENTANKHNRYSFNKLAIVFVEFPIHGAEGPDHETPEKSAAYK